MEKFEDYIKKANRDIQYCEEKGYNELKEYVASLLSRNEELEAENKNLQQRIEKAIKYIDEMCLCSSGYCKYGDDLSPKHIVDILKGE